MFSFILRKLLSRRLTLQFVAVFCIFTVVVFGISVVELKEVDGDLLAAVAVLFGLYVGFLISSQRGRQNSFFEVNRTESSRIYSIYLFSLGLDQKNRKELAKLLDEYQASQLDYNLYDYRLTNPLFVRLTKFCIGMKVESEEAKDAKSRILSLIPDHQKSRYVLQSLLEDRVSRSEWVAVGSLYSAMLYSFLLIDAPDLLSKFLATLVCTSVTMVLLLLYKLSRLQFNVQNKIWKPIERLYLDMGMLPYYPKDVLEAGLIKPAPAQKVRVAMYPNPYPDMSGKQIEVVEV